MRIAVIKGFTLLEMLLVILVTSLLLLVTVPNFQQVKADLFFSIEQRGLSLFLRQAQAKIANSNEIWLLIANRDLGNQRWCLTIQRKTDQICDCLFVHHCPNSVSPQFYFSKATTMLSTTSYYPKEISRINGTRDTWKATCLALTDGNQTKVFSLFNIGSLRLKQKTNSLSACLTEDS